MLLGLALVTILLLAGCGSSEEGSAEAGSRVERCTERFLQRVQPMTSSESERAEIRRYVQTTYCTRFDKRGWVYDDGTLSIEAHVGLVESGSEVCARAEPGTEARTVPCEELDGHDSSRVLDCAILHHVRRNEVSGYVKELQRSHAVRCDDGTPLDELGAP